MRSVLVLLACAAAAIPQEKTQPALSAEQIIEKSIEATGGRAAMEKLTSTWAKGAMEFSAQEAHGSVELFAKAPNRQLVVMTLEGFGDIKQGFDGQVAWAQDPTGHITEITGAPLDDMKRSMVFNASLRWKEIYPKVVLIGQDPVGDRKAWLLELTPSTGRAVKRWYDAETFLLLRESGTRETPQGAMDIRADFSDYRDVAGIKAPFKIRQSMAMGDIVMSISEIRNNVEIEDAKFAKPGK